MWEPINNRFRELAARLDRVPAFQDGVVVTVSPLVVALDGDVDADGVQVTVPVRRELVGGLDVADRVTCLKQHRSVTVVGRAGGDARVGDLESESAFHPRVLAGRATIPIAAANVVYTAVVTLPTGYFSGTVAMTANCHTSVPHQRAWSVSGDDSAITIYAINLNNTTAMGMSWMVVQTDE